MLALQAAVNSILKQNFERGDFSKSKPLNNCLQQWTKFMLLDVCADGWQRRGGTFSKLSIPHTSTDEGAANALQITEPPR